MSKKNLKATAKGAQIATTGELRVKAWNLKNGSALYAREGGAKFGLDPKTPYPSVALNSAYVADMVECAPDLAVDIFGWGDCGYTLIDGKLVPNSFVDQVKKDLDNTMLDYGQVVDVKALFSTEFMNALDADEQAVLGPCVLLLIARGDVAFNFPSQEGTVA